MKHTRLLLRAAASCLLGLLAACSGGHYVVATSSTVLGIEVSQNPQTQIPTGRVGYARNEFALVPTNRTQPSNEQSTTVPTGADKSTDVLMEVKATGLLSFNAGIYQRLAVGRNAVVQPGAALMFARDEDGKIDGEALAAIQALQAKLAPASIGQFYWVRSVRDLIHALANDKPADAQIQKLKDDLDQVSGLDPASAPLVLQADIVAPEPAAEDIAAAPATPAEAPAASRKIWSERMLDPTAQDTPLDRTLEALRAYDEALRFIKEEALPLKEQNKPFSETSIAGEIKDWPALEARRADYEAAMRAISGRVQSSEAFIAAVNYLTKP